MKKILLLLIAFVFAINYSHAQWTTTGNKIYYNGGNVGIGTTNPFSNLSVQGYTSFGDVNGTGNGGIFSTGSNGFSFSDNYYPDGWMIFSSGRAVLGDQAGDINGTCFIIDDPSSTISANSGIFACGLLEASPGNSSMAALGSAYGPSLNYGTSYLGFNVARNGNWNTNGDGFHNGGGVMYTSIFGDMYFAPIESTGTGNKSLSDADIKSRITFRITPTAAYAKQVYVQLTGWPDFVFRKNYKLRSLLELKTFIDLNHRLPDMPSEQQVAKDGLNLGEMNKLLTKKVEELTLYLIEKDKEIKDEKALNEKTAQSQQQQIDELKKQVALLIKQK